MCIAYSVVFGTKPGIGMLHVAMHVAFSVQLALAEVLGVRTAKEPGVRKVMDLDWSDDSDEEIAPSRRGLVPHP